MDQLLSYIGSFCTYLILNSSRPRHRRIAEESHRYQHMEDLELRKGGGRGQKERSRVDRRKRSPSREDQVSSTSSRKDVPEVDKGQRKVYISWDRFVPKSFLQVHFSRFGEVEYIWMADRGAFFGFVNFVREEVGRSLVGACHYVEGVQILIKKAKPDRYVREGRRIKKCAFFKEGRCLRHGQCRFLHSAEPRTSRGRSRSPSRERTRKRERLSVDQWHEELMARKGRDVSGRLSQQKQESSKVQSLKDDLPDKESSERDGRLKPPPSVQEKVKVRDMLPLPVSAQSAEVRKKEEIPKKEEIEKMGKVENISGKGDKRESKGNDRKVHTSGDDMNQEAMKARIRQLEQALKEKEEAEVRKKQFLTGKSDKGSRMEKHEGLKKEKSSGKKFDGSKKNCQLVKSLAKRFKAVEKDSTSSSSGDTDGSDSTSDSNTQSPSPSPPARQLLAKVSRPGGSESPGNHDGLLDSKVKTLELQKIEDNGEPNMGGTVAIKIPARKFDEGERPSKSVLIGAAEDCNMGKENVEEQQQEQEPENQKRGEGDEEDDFDLNENMLGSKKETDCGEDLASSDLCEVRTSFFLSSIFI